MFKKDMCNVVIRDRHDLGAKRKYSKGKYQKKERQILKALTLAKSFASPPLAAIVNTLDNEPAANPIV